MYKKTRPALCVLSLTLLLASAGGYAAESNSGTSSPGQMSVLAVKDMHDAFMNDKARADDEYLKKIMTVKGVAVYVGPDVYALPSIELSEQKDGTPRMLSVLPVADYLQLRKVSKGQEVTVTGEIRTFYDGKMILMKNARIVE